MSKEIKNLKAVFFLFPKPLVPGYNNTQAGNFTIRPTTSRPAVGGFFPEVVMASSVITIVCRITAKKGKAAALKKELTALTKATVQEAGNINYTLHAAKENKALFIIYENWKNQKALDAHMKSPHLQAFFKKADDLLAGPVEGTICTKLL